MANTAINDPRLDPSAKTVGKPYNCQLDELPLLPVRFSLSHEALNEAAETGTVPPMATGINDKNYNLRRLRQGYFYILARVKHVGYATDSKKRWLVFEYNVSSDDSNAPEVSKDRTGTKLRYYFTQYVWKDGHARSKWEKLPKSLPYAYVHPQVGAIECAYSEDRWSPEMFEELERNEAKRKTVMQYISFSGKTGNFVFPGALLEEKVADFNSKNLQKDKEDSARRATGIGFDPSHRAFTYCSINKTLVIAVHDPIGNIKDVSAYHQTVMANDMDTFAKELYPIITAKAIQQIKSRVYHNPNWLKRTFSSPPITDELRSEMDKYANKSPFTQFKVTHNLATAQFNLLHQHGNFTPLAHSYFLNDLMKAHEKNSDKLVSTANYAMVFYARAMAGFGDTPQGAQMQAKMLTEAGEWGNNLSNLLSVVDKLNQGTAKIAEGQLIKALNFSVMIESVMAAQMVAWSENIAGAIPLQRYLNVFSLKMESLTIRSAQTVGNAAKVINEQMKGLVQDSKSLFQKMSLAHYEEELRKTPRAIKSQHHIDVKVNLVVQGENRPAEQVMKITAEVGTLLAGGLLLMNLREWTKPKDKQAESVFLHPIARLTNDFAALIGSLERKALSQVKLDAVFSRLNQRMLKTIRGLLTKPKPLALIGRAGQGHLKLVSFQNAGRFANVLGVLIAKAQADLAERKGDNAAKYAAWAGGVAEISFLISTLTTGLAGGAFLGIGIVLAISSVIISTVGDNDFEAWVRSGFWGNSPEYWGRNRLDEFQDQLNEAMILGEASNPLSNNYQKMQTFFETEMQGFYNLIWDITINTIRIREHILIVYCPAFEHKDSAEKLQVEIEIQQTDNVYGMGISPPIRLPTANRIGKTFLYQGAIEVDLSKINSLRGYHYTQDTTDKRLNYDDTLTVRVKYPKLGRDLSGFWGGLRAEYFETQIMLIGVK